MSVYHPFASPNPRPSPWGYNWTVDEIGVAPRQHNQVTNHCPLSPEPPPPHQQHPHQAAMSPDQLANLPAALLGTLKREKKPFTYTPGGVNLSEVLNARLQKRMERKKKYCEEVQQRAATRQDHHPPKQVIVMPTYNSPLDMYSMENALEALEVQAELVAADKSLSSSPAAHPTRSATLPRNHTFRFEDKDLDPGKNVTQSKAFRVLQIITDTEEQNEEKPRVQHRDEMRFTGIRETRTIPSRFFHTLQKITGTEEEEGEDQEMTMHGPGDARPAQFQKQAAPVSRPSFLPQSQQPAEVHRQTVPAPQQSFGSAPALKRPAAFLPMKTTPCFRPVQLSFVSNGPRRKSGNPTAGTDF